MKKMPLVTAGVHPQGVGLGSEQGLSDFETAGVAVATSRILKARKRSSGPKDAPCGLGCPSTRVGFGSEQGLSDFKTGGVVVATSRILKERKRSSGPKDAPCDLGCPSTRGRLWFRARLE